MAEKADLQNKESLSKKDLENFLKDLEGGDLTFTILPREEPYFAYRTEGIGTQDDRLSKEVSEQIIKFLQSDDNYRRRITSKRYNSVLERYLCSLSNH